MQRELVEGEAGLRNRSLVNVSQIFTVDKANLADRIGTLSPSRWLVLQLYG